jgi:hypothetical protein
VIDFLMTVSTMFSVQLKSRRVNLRMSSLRHMRASLVTPDRRLPMHCSSSPTTNSRLSSPSSSEWNYTMALILFIESNWMLQLLSFISTSARSS